MENDKVLELSYFLNSVLLLLQQADRIEDVTEDTKIALLNSAKETSKAIFEELVNEVKLRQARAYEKIAEDAKGETEE